MFLEDVLSVADTRRTIPPVASLYIHVPFCFHKCHYCDFYSIVDSRDRQEVFTQRLVHELHALAPLAAGAPLRTLFVGGGTPSLLAVPHWRNLLHALETAFDLSAMHAGTGEFTVECNPETVTPELMQTLRAGGVTRVSIGCQSFNPQHLKTLERWHDPANVPKALAMARDAGITRSSIDLIYAIPGQTLAEWDADLRMALGLGVEHLSCYCLTYEANTAMTKRLARGDFIKATEDLEADMFEHTVATLQAQGVQRYEVSNFARPGQECRHNLAYWRQDNWLAAGPSASGHVHGLRWKNLPRLDDYLSLEQHGVAAITDVELPDARRALRERLWTSLRLREGVDTTRVLADAAALDPSPALSMQRVADRQMALGALVSRTDADGRPRWQLSNQGFLIADAVAREFLHAIG
jgi:oxygen-independent coproporphyrinogen III oxidase